ncbi:MAG: hypothetical protein AMXMBFR82_48150 [Candidatus Hydrogenedentota bacterium]
MTEAMAKYAQLRITFQPVFDRITERMPRVTGLTDQSSGDGVPDAIIAMGSWVQRAAYGS